MRPSLWSQNEYRPTWPIFNGSVILPYIYRTIWLLNVILSDNESVWCNDWPYDKCRSQLLYFMVHWCCLMSKSIWLNIVLSDNELVWYDDWPYDKCRSPWPIFHGPCDFDSFCLQIHFVLLAKRNSGKLRCPATSLIFILPMGSLRW